MKLELMRRTVEWTDPAAARAVSAGWTGLQIMQAIRDGRLPPPPMARLIGFQCVEAEVGRIVMVLSPDPSLENTIGLVHGATAAAMLDTAMGAAAHTRLDAGSGVVTLDLHITYLRPLTLASGPLRATGTLVSLGRTNAYVTGEMVDGAGKLAAHAVGNFSILNSKG